MKRRSFFAALVAGAASLVAGIPVLRTLVRTAPRRGTEKVVATIHPMAVGRGRKGGPHA